MNIQEKLEKAAGEGLIVALRYGDEGGGKMALQVTAITFHGITHQRNFHISSNMSFTLPSELEEFGQSIKKASEYRKHESTARRAAAEMQRIREAFPKAVEAAIAH
jgi:hypothetical protein